MFFPLNIIGYVLEFFYLRLLNDQEVITVSESTKKDLMRYGFKKDRIHIISEGIQCEPLAQLPAIHHAKYDTPTILSLGAVRAMKRADHIVTAFNILKSTSSHSHKNLSHLHDNSCHSRAGENPEYEEATSCHSRAGGNPGNKDVVKNQQKTCQSIHKNNNLKYKQQIKNAKLIIAGDIHDPYAQKVLHNVAKSPYKNDITVLGRVSTEKKWELMQKSHLIAVTSIKEGWGLIVTEAASQGTPAVVYDVDGLRDAVEWGDAGYMTKDNTPKALANEMIQALQDEDKYERIRQYAWHKSQKLTFEKSYKDFFL
ncbi:MAG: hypothetical protein CR972_02320 [Candidatus Moraniibacteriota bacterium]|nr:MAG: hypothetical protein CR972_02320 [Candidatus Moranbacteria bacterium]